ncbi:hypothetical protein CFN79_04700 [Chromobacterium vaccinii]|nr:hypothetical protein CFN79_04700 [Chromobacterium vaccinii]
MRRLRPSGRRHRRRRGRRTGRGRRGALRSSPLARPPLRRQAGLNTGQRRIKQEQRRIAQQTRRRLPAEGQRVAVQMGLVAIAMLPGQPGQGRPRLERRVAEKLLEPAQPVEQLGGHALAGMEAAGQAEPVHARLRRVLAQYEAGAVGKHPPRQAPHSFQLRLRPQPSAQETARLLALRVEIGAPDSCPQAIRPRPRARRRRDAVHQF